MNPLKSAAQSRCKEWEILRCFRKDLSALEAALPGYRLFGWHGHRWLLLALLCSASPALWRPICTSRLDSPALFALLRVVLCTAASWHSRELNTCLHQYGKDMERVLKEVRRQRSGAGLGNGALGARKRTDDAGRAGTLVNDQSSGAGLV